MPVPVFKQMNSVKLILSVLILVVTIVDITYARGIYQEPIEFLNEVFNENPSDPHKLWIRKELKPQINEILGHDLGVLRVSYWKSDSRTVWIIDEVGKDQPITTGVVIRDNQIELIRVLIFRETRGWEIRHPFFTNQFNNAMLVQGVELDVDIDGISGATLSVNAMIKLAKLALLFHKQVMDQE